MTISVWRYSHLTLAVSSFLFIALLSLTGIILSIEPVVEKTQPYRADNFSEITLDKVLPVLKDSFLEVTELKVDHNDFVIIDGLDANGDAVKTYIDPNNGKQLGKPEKRATIYQWVETLHRSLFMHEAGRVFVGFIAFLLLMIAVSGIFLVVQRQRGWKQFYSKVTRDGFSQYWHVVLGRISLFVIVLISLTGMTMVLKDLKLIPKEKISHKINFENLIATPRKNLADIDLLKTISLADVNSIEFPFSEEPEDYYLLKLRDREIAFSQITGAVLSEVPYPFTSVTNTLSKDLHTGQKNAAWAIVLGLSAISILFFIYSGFVITLKRRAGLIKNKYDAAAAEFIILVGSENGSTFRFAKALHQSLIAKGCKSFLTELNQYQTFDSAKHLIILTSTYGTGEPPANATKFLSLVDKHSQAQKIQFSVVGFGSHSYPDFCQFAYNINNLLGETSWAVPFLEIHTVNEKSPVEFGSWLEIWSQQTGLQLGDIAELYTTPAKDLVEMKVLTLTPPQSGDRTFLIQLLPQQNVSFRSGDLLAIYPANDHRERFYSIGKKDNSVQLSVKLHAQGLGSSFLHQLKAGDVIQAIIKNNPHFHFPRKAKAIVMISNGTGIAPFLGMVDENTKQIPLHLYCGFRNRASFFNFKDALENSQQAGKLQGLHIAYSREGAKQYVLSLLQHDEQLIIKVLDDDGVLMLCGSLAMQKDVLTWLDHICGSKTKYVLTHYQSRGQVLMDCY